MLPAAGPGGRERGRQGVVAIRPNVAAHYFAVKEPRARIGCAFERIRTDPGGRSLRGFLRVAKLGGDQLENRVGERDDVRPAVAAVPKLSVDRLCDNPNTAGIDCLRLRALCSSCPHLAAGSCRMRAIRRKRQTVGFSRRVYNGIYKAGRLLPHLCAEPLPPVTVRTMFRAGGISANLHTHVTS